MPSTTLTYRLGDPDARYRRPVIIGKDTIIGYVSRWHREWDAESSAGTHNVGRPEVGQKGADRAAAYLIKEYAAGRITPIPARTAAAAQAIVYGPAPLLDPRMPYTRANRERAEVAWVTVARFRWIPRAGFPGSDNPWEMVCPLPCQAEGHWTGMRYMSHLRGRNGNPPSAHRHLGCLSEAEVRRLVPAYGPGKTG